MKQTLVLAAILVVYVWADGHDWTVFEKSQPQFDFNFERDSLEIETNMGSSGLIALKFLTASGSTAGQVVLSIPRGTATSEALGYHVDNCQNPRTVERLPEQAFENPDTRIWTFTRSTEDLHIMVNGVDLIHVVYAEDCTGNVWSDFWAQEAVKAEYLSIDSMTEKYRATEKPGDNDGDNDGDNNVPEVECGRRERLCDDGTQCVSTSHWCDGFADCDDESDEGDHCASHECDEGYRKCDDGLQCILSDYWCGEREREFVDCNDGSDEGTHCDSNETETEECEEGYRRCDDGVQCIRSRNWCDGGSPDCDDNSDEGDQCLNYECPEGYRKCDDGLECIYANYWCDNTGRPDCEDESDEGSHCDYWEDGEVEEEEEDEGEEEEEEAVCGEGERRCDDGLQCIRASFWCANDGADCGDRSDEGTHCDYYGVDCSDPSNMNSEWCMSAARQSHLLSGLLILLIAAIQILGF